MENVTVEEGRTMAIISYITIIGTVIAIVMNNDKKNTFASFHIRQALGIFLIFVVAAIVGRFSGTLSWVIDIFGLVLLVMGLIGAVQREEKLIPVLGEQFQDWFKGIG